MQSEGKDEQLGEGTLTSRAGFEPELSDSESYRRDNHYTTDKNYFQSKDKVHVIREKEIGGKQCG